MQRNILIILLTLFAAVAHLKASDSDAEKFPDIDLAFRDWGNDVMWRSYRTTTADGYKLTMFRILGQSDGTTLPNHGEKGPILLLHGFSTSALTWFNRRDKSRIVTPVQYYEAGYDVWLGSIRGTRYCREHKRYDADFDNMYWDFDNSDVAENDLYAMLAKIHKVSDTCQKITLLAHSGGATQAFNLLAKTSRAHKYISQYIALEPCIVANVDDFFPGMSDNLYRVIDPGL